MFILLTNEDNEKVYVDIDKICYFQKTEVVPDFNPYEDHEPIEVTEIGFVGEDSIFVKEPVETVAGLIGKSIRQLKDIMRKSSKEEK